MDFLGLCQKRFSARKYSEEPVANDDLDYILECVRIAPSAVNFQPWKFVVVKSSENLEKLQECYDRDWFKTAPLAIIAYKNIETEWVRKYDDKRHGDIDVAIAVEHLCLAATQRNLGSCWICNFDVELLTRSFPMQSKYIPVAIIPIGHIAVDCPIRKQSRKAKEEIFQFT